MNPTPNKAQIRTKVFHKKQDAKNNLTPQQSLFAEEIRDTRPNTKNQYCYRFLAVDKRFIKALINGTTPIDIIENNKKNTFNTNFLYEVLDEAIRKIHFDIDKINIQVDTFNEYLDEFHVEHMKLINEPLDTEKIVFVRNEPDDMIRSARIIYPRLSMDKSDNKKLVSTLNSLMELSKNELICDMKVYTVDRLFNLLGHTKIKYGMDRRFVLLNGDENDYTYEQYLIKNTQDTKLIEYSIDTTTNMENIQTVDIEVDNYNLVDKLIEHLPKEFYKLHGMWLDLAVFIYKSNFDIYSFLQHSGVMSNTAHGEEAIDNFICEHLKWSAFYGDSVLQSIHKRFGIRFNLPQSATCEFLEWASEITDIPLDKLTQDIAYIEVKNEKLSKANKIKAIETDEWVIKPNQQTILDKENSTFHYYPQSKITTDNDYVKTSQKLSLNEIQVKVCSMISIETIIAVRAIYGSGKTAKVVMNKVKYLLESKTSPRILFITENNSLNTELTNKISARFPEKEYGDNVVISHQDNQNVDLSQYRIIVCSVESLKSKVNTDFYDLVVLDEYESVMYQFSSTTCNRKNVSDYELFAHFSQIVANSNQIIALDADLSLDRIKLLEDIADKKSIRFTATDNKYRDLNYKMLMFYDKKQLEDKMLREILEDKKIVIMASSVNDLTDKKCELVELLDKDLEEIEATTQLNESKMTLVKMLKDNKISRNILMITANDDAFLLFNGEQIDISKKAVLAQLENVLFEYSIDIFMYSPTITTGVSVDKYEMFSVYARLFNVNTPIVRATNQMFHRVRRLTSGEINICFTNSLTFAPLNRKAFLPRVKKLLELTLRLKNGTDYDPKKIDKNYCQLRFLNDCEISIRDKMYVEQLYITNTHHGIKMINVWTDPNKKEKDDISKLTFDNYSALRKEEERRILRETQVMTQTEITQLIKDTDSNSFGRKRTNEEQQQINNHFRIHDSTGYREYQHDDQTDNVNIIYDKLIQNDDYANGVIRNYEDIKNYHNLKYETEYKHYDKQTLDNMDICVATKRITQSMLSMFNYHNGIASNTNEQVKKIVSDNTEIIKKYWTTYQEVLKFKKIIRFDTINDIDKLVLSVKLVISQLPQFKCGYMTSSKKVLTETATGMKYSFHYHNNKDIYNMPNKTWYIANTLADWYKHKNYTHPKRNDTLKITDLPNKKFLKTYPNGDKEILHKKPYTTTGNKAIVSGNPKKQRQKIMGDNKLFETEMNNYSKVEEQEVEYKTTQDVRDIRTRFTTTSNNQIKITINIPKYKKIVEKESPKVDIESRGSHYTTTKPPTINTTTEQSIGSFIAENSIHQTKITGTVICRTDIVMRPIANVNNETFYIKKKYSKIDLDSPKIFCNYQQDITHAIQTLNGIETDNSYVPKYQEIITDFTSDKTKAELLTDYTNLTDIEIKTVEAVNYKLVAMIKYNSTAEVAEYLYNVEDNNPNKLKVYNTPYKIMFVYKWDK